MTYRKNEKIALDTKHVFEQNKFMHWLEKLRIS